MHDSGISFSAQPVLQTTDVAVRQPQPPRRFHLLQMTFLHLLQHLQPLPLSGAQADPLLFHGASQPPEKRTFLLCTNRTFSFCGDTECAVIDLLKNAALRWPPQSGPQMIGQTVSRYLILEKIGAGGMGDVYRAYDERLDRDVAVKVLPPGIFRDEAARKRFHKEALALSKLNHPNIATIHDFDTQDGIDFLVMEYITGTTLSHKLSSEALSEKDVAAFGLQIASALEEAHEHGIVHRDLKPSNILVTSKNQVKILDFGLAVLLKPSAAAEATQSDTDVGGISGTLPYMAPEQLLGMPVDTRSDIYSLGTILFEMVTGRRPFDQMLSTALCNYIIYKPPPRPAELRHNLSARLEEVILKCLEKEPENRYQSAKELVVDLRRLSAPATGIVYPAERPRWRVRRWQAVLALSIAVVTIGALFLARYYMVRGGGQAIDSLAILPFENVSPNPDAEYLSNGLTESLINSISQLSRIQGVDLVLIRLGQPARYRQILAACNFSMFVI
jgi:serine/threonine protein kinase